MALSNAMTVASTVFVGNDTKAIGHKGDEPRGRLRSELFGIRAMTLEEFKSYCAPRRSQLGSGASQAC
jgi:hypothetical protein